MYKKTDYLSDDAKLIREEVFMQEQKFIDEFDDIDNYAKHVVIYNEDEAVAVGRYFPTESQGQYVIGRVAVRRAYRGKKLGKEIVEIMEKLILEEGGKKIILSAQKRVKDFYKGMGYRETGESYFEEHCEHIVMEKDI